MGDTQWFSLSLIHTSDLFDTCVFRSGCQPRQSIRAALVVSLFSLARFCQTVNLFFSYSTLIAAHPAKWPQDDNGDSRRLHNATDLLPIGFEIDPKAWLADRREKLEKRLDHMGRALKSNAIPDVRNERKRLIITPHDAVTPPAALRLDRAINAVMPRIRITELLWEVSAKTGFLDAFTDLRSGKHHHEPAAVLATILAGPPISVLSAWPMPHRASATHS